MTIAKLNRHLRNIAIDGGSFDPLHNDHITRLKGIMCSAEFLALKIDQLMIIPSGSGGRRDKTISTDPNIRLAMTHLLKDYVQPFSQIPIDVNEMDIHLAPNMPTFQIWQKLKDEPIYKNTRFFFILGSDWQPDQILEKWVNGYQLTHPENGTDFIIAPREGYPKLYDDVKWPNFHWVNYPPEFIPGQLSSSEIRKKVKNGEDVILMVPPPVYEIIKTVRLYR